MDQRTSLSRKKVLRETWPRTSQAAHVDPSEIPKADFFPADFDTACERGDGVIAWGNKWHRRRPYIIRLYANTSASAPDIYPVLPFCAVHTYMLHVIPVFRCFVAKLDLPCRSGMRDACHVALSLSPVSLLLLSLSVSHALSSVAYWNAAVACDHRTPACARPLMRLRPTARVLLTGNPVYMNVFSAPFICCILGAIKSLRCHVYLKKTPLLYTSVHGDRS